MNNNFFKYLSIGTLEEMWGLYVTTVGYSQVNPFECYPQGKHPQSHELTWNRGRTLNDYYLIFISKGKGIFSSAHTTPIDIEAGTCFFLFPGVWHRYKPEAECGWEEYWIGFHGSYADQLMKQNFFTPENPFIHVGLDKEILILFTKMFDCIRSSFMGYHQQLAGIALQILGLVNTTSVSRKYDANPVEKLISKAKFLIQESFERPLNTEKLAMDLPMGYSAFRKHFKTIVGESPHQYHQRIRLERAKELLETTLLNINEISDRTGFDSVYHFSKLFKAKTGVSPSVYRDSLSFPPL